MGTVTTTRQLLFSISFELGKQLGSRALVDAVPEVCKLREGAAAAVSHDSRHHSSCH